MIPPMILEFGVSLKTLHFSNQRLLWNFGPFSAHRIVSLGLAPSGSCLRHLGRCFVLLVLDQEGRERGFK